MIARLVDGGVLRPLPRVPTGRAGRPALRWAVNPSLWDTPSRASANDAHREMH